MYRYPVSLKIFLTALAIADDLGAILVIALFYGGTVQIGCLLVASGLESYTGWAMAGCFVGALVLLALAVVLAGLGNCAEQEEDEKPCKERQPQEKRAADRRKAG